MEPMGAKKLAAVAMKNHVLVMTEMKTTVKPMFSFMEQYFATLNGLSHILENMAAKSLVIFAKQLPFVYCLPLFNSSRNGKKLF